MLGTRKSVLAITGLAVAGVVTGILVSQFHARQGDDLPVQSLEYYEVYSDTVGDLARRADVVFVGVVVRYERNVLALAADAEDVDKSVTIFDGIVFKPVEVLKGNVVGEVVVGTPVEMRDASGRPTSRIEQPPIQLVRPAIAAIGDKKEPKSFLVFASEMEDTNGIFAFFGTGGITQILPSGRLAPGVAPPFVQRSNGPASALSMGWEEIRQAIIAATGAD